MNAAELTEALRGRWRGSYGIASCPLGERHSHGDKSPSFSIKDADDGKLLVHCQRGCDQPDVIARLIDMGLWEPHSEPRPVWLPTRHQSTNGTTAAAERRIVAAYDYTDELGSPLFQTVRYEPKDFRQRYKHGAVWKWTLNGVRRVVYNLPQVVDASTVYVVEGEKDADLLTSLGLVATTSPLGAGKWQPEYAEWFRGKHVILLPDNDAPGRKHMQDIERSLHPVAASVVTVQLPDVPEKGDVSDWFAAGGTLERLLELVNTPQKPVWRTLGALVRATPDYGQELIEGLLWQGLTHWAYSSPGAGKTLFCLAELMHMAAGKSFCGRQVIQGPVVLVEEDSPDSIISSYVQMLADIYQLDLDTLPFWINTTRGIRITDDACVTNVRNMIAAAPEKPAVIVLDACERIVPSERFNSKELDPLSKLFALNQADGIANLMIDHTRKPQGQGDEKPEPIDLLYGGRAKSAISDVMMHFSGAIKSQAVITFPKFRGESPSMVTVSFDGSVGFSLKVGKPVLTESERMVMMTLTNAFGEMLTREEIDVKAGLKNDTTLRALQKLIKIGYVKRVGENRDAVYGTDANPGLFQ